MKIIKIGELPRVEIVKIAKQILEKEGLVVIPSDTAYGLAANAVSEKAVAKVNDFKGLRYGKWLSVFVSSINKIKEYAKLSSGQRHLIESLLPGPFTIVLESRHQLAKNIEPPDGTIGIRVIDRPLIRQLTASLTFPITATSANVSGKGPHYSVEAFLTTLSGKKKSAIDLVIDAGSLPPRQTSTVVRLAGGQIEVLRQGALDLQKLGSWNSDSEEKTKRAAQKIFKKYFLPELGRRAVVVVLKGPLGAGKTVFTKGIGELFDLQLKSPTFTLMDEYQIQKLKNPKTQKTKELEETAIIPGVGEGPPQGWSGHLKNIYHLDLYRIEDQQEIIDLELEKLIKPSNLLLIEWGEKLTAFEHLKNAGAAFFWLQIEDISKSKRKLQLYKL